MHPHVSSRMGTFLLFLTTKEVVDREILSPHILFLFVAEILGIMIRQNEKIKGITLNGIEHTIGQYADDTELFIDGSETSLNEAIKTLTIFYNMSGLKIY